MTEKTESKQAKGLDNGPASAVYERLSENYFEQRRLQYRLLVGYFVGVAAVVWFFSDSGFVPGDFLFKVFVTLGGLLFTTAVVVWLYLLDRSQKISRNKLMTLSRILLGPDADDKLQQHEASGTSFRRCYIWVLCSAVAIIGLMFVLVVWRVPHQQSAQIADAPVQSTADVGLSKVDGNEHGTSDSDGDPPDSH